MPEIAEAIIGIMAVTTATMAATTVMVTEEITALISTLTNRDSDEAMKMA